MKNWLKLWIATVAVLCAFAISISWTNKAEAAKKITVTLNTWTITDSCDDIADYAFTWTVSLSEQTLAEKSNNLKCTFAKTSSQTVTIQSSQLSWPINVPANNILLTSVANCSAKSWSIASWTCLAKNSSQLWSAVEVMNKAENTIWSATMAIKIKVKMPAWAPQGTYNWTLTVTWP